MASPVKIEPSATSAPCTQSLFITQSLSWLTSSGIFVDELHHCAKHFVDRRAEPNRPARSSALKLFWGAGTARWWWLCFSKASERFCVPSSMLAKVAVKVSFRSPRKLHHGVVRPVEPRVSRSPRRCLWPARWWLWKRSPCRLWHEVFEVGVELVQDRRQFLLLYSRHARKTAMICVVPSWRAYPSWSEPRLRPNTRQFDVGTSHRSRNAPNPVPARWSFYPTSPCWRRSRKPCRHLRPRVWKRWARRSRGRPLR